MAFYYKEKSDDCRAWISKNQNLYENTIDNIKSFLELGGLLHIYGVIRFALERKKWIDSEISFLLFYSAFDLAIQPFTEESFHLISRNKGSKVYHNNPTLLLHEQKGQLDKAEEQRLFEVERICKLLDDLKPNTERTMEIEAC